MHKSVKSRLRLTKVPDCVKISVFPDHELINNPEPQNLARADRQSETSRQKRNLHTLKYSFFCLHKHGANSSNLRILEKPDNGRCSGESIDFI